MTIDYKALAERVKAIADGYEASAVADGLREEIADLRTVVSLLEGMAEAEPRAYIECAIFGQADDDLVWKKGAVGHYIPLFTRPAPQPIPEGWKLIKDSTREERSWPEDYPHENGNYFNNCYRCERQFMGHKRRVACKVCATVPVPAPQPQPTEAQIEAAAKWLDHHLPPEIPACSNRTALAVGVLRAALAVKDAT